MTADDFALLLAGKSSEHLRLGAGVELAPPAVLEMLAGLRPTTSTATTAIATK